MTTAQQLFIGYAMSVLVVGFALGCVLGVLRMKAPAVRNLATAHVETLMQAALHLGLAFAVGAVGFGSAAATWGASLLVAGSAMHAIGVTLNWVTDTGDQFAERAPGFKLSSLATFVIVPGMVIVVIGVFTRL